MRLERLDDRRLLLAGRAYSVLALRAVLIVRAQVDIRRRAGTDR